MNQRLLELAYAHDELAELDPPSRRLALRDLVSKAAPDVDPADVVAGLADEIDGFGPLTPLMEDPEVTDVLVNGCDETWVERAGKLHRAAVTFEDAEQVARLARRLLGRAGRRVDLAHPVSDARLPDGSRLHVVLPPVAPAGPLLSIRRHPSRRLTLDALTEAGAVNGGQRSELRRHLGNRDTIVLAGGTGSGKTTLLNGLLGEVGASERVVTIEETSELRPACPHVASLVARPPSQDGAGEIDLTLLVRAALRMRPDRIVVGEVRGGEALAAIDAISTGHRGSMMTIHARSAEDALDRMVVLARRGDRAPDQETLARLVRKAVDVVVYLERDADGSRRVVAMVEIA